jgi:hypothetical protein
MVANIASDDALILPHRTNPAGLNFRERTNSTRSLHGYYISRRHLAMAGDYVACSPSRCLLGHHRHGRRGRSTLPSTTLADLFTLLFAANPFSAAWASLWRWSSDEFEDGLAHVGQCRSRRRPVGSFFPPCCFKPAILKESVGDHRHERMTVKALPGSALEVIKTKFFFQLLVSLLANPSCLDGGR